MAPLRYLSLFLFAVIVACTTPREGQQRPVEPQPVSPKSTEKAQKPELRQSTGTASAGNPAEQPAGSPVASANQSMQRASKKMSETIKLVRQLQAGDQVYDCRDTQQRQQAFQSLQAFFGPENLAYDEYTFWFLTNDGSKVGLNENDGILRDCTIGMFESFKRVITVQLNGAQTIRTEFYVDPSTGNFMVHRYRDQQRINANYRLKAH